MKLAESNNHHKMKSFIA